MKAFRSAVVVGVLLASSVVPALPAAADVGLFTYLTMFSGTVGQTDRPGSFILRNNNTSPHSNEANIVREIRLAPSCGAVGTLANLCSVLDPGVFSIGSVATGRGGTTCTGRVFAVSAPDASGAVTFTPNGGTLTLPPQNPETEEFEDCVVDFTYSVLKTPTIDTDSSVAAQQTRANLLVTVQGALSGLIVSSLPSLGFAVYPAIPMVTTSAARDVAAGTISDTATVSGSEGAAVPTGTVTFSVWGPNNAICFDTPLATSTTTLIGGTATSRPVPISQPGTYRFVASYNGDANYSMTVGQCNQAGGTVVASRNTLADFDGNGTTDRSLYRNGSWFVLGQPTVSFGLTGDVPVPADYDGRGDSERAVFRNGAWHVEGLPTVYFGVSGDVPVPGDYNGDGDAERAVFRPSSGAWYVEGMMSPVYLGAPGDIPVPGDYDGNGTTDRAVFRDGAWLVQAQPTVFWGVAGDVPVPGNYDGNSTTDRAVFRNGAWYVHNQATVSLGLRGDIPLPGDYDGNGTTDRVVYRNGAWYTSGQSPTFFGLAGDIPLPLPHAIHSRLA